MASLEEILTKNNELLAIHNDLLTQVLGKAGGGKAAPAGDGEEAPKTRGKGKGAAAKAKSIEDYREGVTDWLGEFAEDDDDPETEHRKDLLKGAFEKLSVAKLTEIEGDDVAKFGEWFEAKKAKGRFTEKPGKAKGGNSLLD